MNSQVGVDGNDPLEQLVGMVPVGGPTINHPTGIRPQKTERMRTEGVPENHHRAGLLFLLDSNNTVPYSDPQDR